MKTILNVKIWVVFAILTGFLSMLYLSFSPERVETIEKKPYMTLKDYNKIDIGMDYDKYLDMAQAIPAGDKELINARDQYKIYSVTYNGKHEAAFATIFIKEHKDGKKVIHDKSQFKLADG